MKKIQIFIGLFGVLLFFSKLTKLLKKIKLLIKLTKNHSSKILIILDFG